MIGTTLNHRFSLEKELGRGGMGAVFRATDQVLQRAVAIKVLKDGGTPELAKQIRLEAQILARLLHDNVVRLYDFGEYDGTSFLVMEEVVGTSYLKRWREVSLIERLKIIAQVAEALDYAHHQGVIHRDVKPGNVLLTTANQAKLSDFGLSTTEEFVDDTKTIRGTPHYMSPEQAQGKRLGHLTDIYSLGIMLYESASGSVPFSGNSMAVISQHVSAQPDPPRSRNREISESLQGLILQMISKDPKNRPTSGKAVADAIREEIRRELNESQGFQLNPSAQSNGSALAPTQQITASSVPKVSPSPVAATVAIPDSVPAISSKALTDVALAKQMLASVQSDPVILGPEERFLCGHYLAYLLGGSRRLGILLRRPLDPKNADRARLVLAMAYVMANDGSEESIAHAARLLEARIDVRPSMSPVVVAKYLAFRDTAAKRKKLRQYRNQVLELTSYAQKNMIDAKGMLNPGLIPANYDDLRKLAPERTEVDDQLVARWNRVAEVWRQDPKFRNAVLIYATRNAARDPASFEIWPEVVYPLIERARWQRRLRTTTEAVWDNVCERILHVPDAGVRMDRAIRAAVPSQVVQEIDLSLNAFFDEPLIDDELGNDSKSTSAEHVSIRLTQGEETLRELTSDIDGGNKDLVFLTSPDPLRFMLGDLRELWQEAVVSLRSPGSKVGHRLVSVGPYRLAVIPSIRGRSAGQIAIQGMANKQIEMLTPSIRFGGSPNKPIVAVWVYEDHSLAIAYLDFKGVENYILWDSATNLQSNFSDPAALNHALFNIGLEAPDQLDRALSKRFRPRNPV
ncbi:serine/threonine-protein kinase [Singulisphaera sp. PoT]|uniref:serine/threonine-protein kinase n=1 Tax=Singulisphaera sp. PoT TaxID=3411797 RepID=UPI003BF54102